jgi:tRNA(fMet)-specific endonuclease VapC
MPFLPDTNVWISLLKNPGGGLDARVRSQATTDILLCSVVKAELWHGAEKYGNRERRLRALEMLFTPFVSLPFDDEAARHYADIRHRLELQGAVMRLDAGLKAALSIAQRTGWNSCPQVPRSSHKLLMHSVPAVEASKTSRRGDAVEGGRGGRRGGGEVFGGAVARGGEGDEGGPSSSGAANSGWNGQPGRSRRQLAAELRHRHRSNQ